MSGNDTKLRVHTAGISKPAADKRYLKLDASNDPVTGELTVNPASGDNAIVIKSGKRLVFDGA